MKDWKGNVIEEGHTVLVVSTGDMWEGAIPCLMAVTERGVETLYEGAPIKKSYSFDVVNRYKVTAPGDVIIDLRDGISEIPINLIDMFAVATWHQIICIEGMSDSRDEYYEHYFNL